MAIHNKILRCPIIIINMIQLPCTYLIWLNKNAETMIRYNAFLHRLRTVDCFPLVDTVENYLHSSQYGQNDWLHWPVTLLTNIKACEHCFKTILWKNVNLSLENAKKYFFYGGGGCNQKQKTNSFIQINLLILAGPFIVATFTYQATVLGTSFPLWRQDVCSVMEI